MVYSLPHVVAQVFADGRQPGYHGVLEVISFLVMSAMMAAAFASAAVLLVLRCIHAIG